MMLNLFQYKYFNASDFYAFEKMLFELDHGLFF